MKQPSVGVFRESFDKCKSFGALLDRHAQWMAQLDAEAAEKDAESEIKAAINQPGKVCRFVKLSVLVMAPVGADDAYCRNAAVKELTDNLSELDLYIDEVESEEA
jgi:hypothetical protein